MQHSQGQNQASTNLNDLRIFNSQDRNYLTSDAYNWNTRHNEEEKDTQSVDNVLDRSGLLDELVCQILDDGTAPVDVVEEETSSTTFMDVVNAKEFVPSCPQWSFGGNQGSHHSNTSTDVTRPIALTEHMNIGASSNVTAQNELQPSMRGKYVASSGKVINPPPGFEQIQNSNANVIPQYPEVPKPPAHISDLERHINTLSSNMFPGNHSPSSIHSNSSDHIPKPYPQDSDMVYQPRLPFNPNQVAQSLLQRRGSTSSPLQLLLSETSGGSSAGSIDSPILSPSSGMSSNPPSPFETNSGDKPISVSQGGTPTRFNFKAPPFVPCQSPLGWNRSDNNPFKMPQQRSNSPIEQRSFNNMHVDPPPTNRMLRGNFPMQPLPLPQSGKPFSAPTNMLQRQETRINYLPKDQNPFYNSNSGRSSPASPFQFSNQQPPMGPYGDTFNNTSRFNYNQGPFPNLKQQGFPRISGFPNKFPNSGSAAFSLHQQHLLQQQLAADTPTSRLHMQLDECCIHVKRLEEERKKTEYELAQMHPGKRISSSNTIQAPQLPDNPSQVDRIIVDVYKEHSRLVTLMSKIEGLCTKSLHPNLEACLDAWMSSIQDAEARRQQEIRNATRRHQERSSPSTMNDEEVTQLADGIEKMKNKTRAARTALWCAYQMARQDIQEKEGKGNVREN